jgi:uncharacterized damage-inducible protein DinB
MKRHSLPGAGVSAFLRCPCKRMRRAALPAATFKRGPAAGAHAGTMQLAHVQPSHVVAPSQEMVALMRYKRWADAELLKAASHLPWLGRWLVGRLVTAIVRHFHTVDCVFRAQLLRVPHAYTSTNPREPKTLGELCTRVAEIDAWYVEYAQNLDATQLGESLDVTFTDGERQVLTRSDILLHVSHHGAYHRGNIGILLRIGGAGALPDRFTSYLRTTDSAR